MDPSTSDASAARDRPPHLVSYRFYTLIWVMLMVLLGATIIVGVRHFTSYSVVINLLISTTKAALVLLFFMHLRYEGRFLKVMLSMAFAALTLIIILTFSDVWFRGK
jgi:cytochrome c oxidase subunit 4